MNLERRTYQERAVAVIVKALGEKRRVLAVGPTGSGKTVVGVAVARATMGGGRVLWLAHKHELVDQAVRAFIDQGITPGVIMAHDEKLHDRRDPDARVQVASVQTVTSRGVPDGTELIVFDEAHHVMADSYQAIAAQAMRAKVLGLTATPCRQDGRGLGEFFEDMVIIARPSELYSGGYLAEPRAFVAPSGVIKELLKRMKGVPVRGGDYAPATLARALDTKTLVGNVVSECLRLAPGVPKVVFAAGVAHSRRIAAAFMRRGIAAAHLDATTPAEERVSIIAGLARGDLEVVCNVDVLSEGWDLPELGAIALARPTRSRGRLLQMTGRVQRPFKGRVPIIIDHGNSIIRLQTHPADDVDWNLESGGDTVRGGGAAVVKGCPGCLQAIPAASASCPACGAEQESAKRARRLTERQAQLVELERVRLDQIRGRVEEVAKAKNAPPGWVERVLSEVRAR